MTDAVTRPSLKLTHAAALKALTAAVAKAPSDDAPPPHR